MSRTTRKVKPGHCGHGIQCSCGRKPLPRAPIYRRKTYVEKDGRKVEPKHPKRDSDDDTGNYFDNFIDGKG